MNMLISCVGKKDGKNVAYILFEDGKLSAEGIIPDCKIISNNGFSGQKVEMLEQYMQENLAMLKRQASEINPVKAMMQEKK